MVLNSSTYDADMAEEYELQPWKRELHKNMTAAFAKAQEDRCINSYQKEKAT